MTSERPGVADGLAAVCGFAERPGRLNMNMSQSALLFQKSSTPNFQPLARPTAKLHWTSAVKGFLQSKRVCALAASLSKTSASECAQFASRKIGIFWDLDNVTILKPHWAAAVQIRRIRDSVLQFGGTLVSVKAYANTITCSNLRRKGALSHFKAANIEVITVATKPERADMQIVTDVYAFGNTIDSACVALISCDNDLAPVLAYLKSRGVPTLVLGPFRPVKAMTAALPPRLWLPRLPLAQASTVALYWEAKPTALTTQESQLLRESRHQNQAPHVPGSRALDTQGLPPPRDVMQPSSTCVASGSEGSARTAGEVAASLAEQRADFVSQSQVAELVELRGCVSLTWVNPHL